MNADQYKSLAHEAKKMGLPFPSRKQYESFIRDGNLGYQITTTETESAKKWSKRRLMKIVVVSALQIVGVVISTLTIQQLWVSRPSVTALDFSAKDPFRGMFVINNPLSFQMYDIQMTSKPGFAGMPTYAYRDWNPQKPRSACQMLAYIDRHQDESKKDAFLHRQSLLPIEAGTSRPFNDSGFYVGGVKMVIGVGTSYKIRVLGIPIHRFVCDEFDSYRDNDGKMHLIHN